MIGPILLAISWLLLRFERTSLGALGFNAPVRRARQFAAGFLVAGLVVAAQQGGLALAVGTSWATRFSSPLPRSGFTIGSHTEPLAIPS
jgi:hypothetical protein